MSCLFQCRAANGTDLGMIDVGPRPVFYSLDLDSNADPIETMSKVSDPDSNRVNFELFFF